MYSDDIAGGPDPSTPNLSEEQEAEKKALLLSSRSGKLDTIQEKIAWILNHYPATRDSDTALAIKFLARISARAAGRCVCGAERTI